MPIIIKDFEWSESSRKLEITIPQRNVKSSSIDVMCTEAYVKVNYSPYFFELHLKGKVDDNKTRVVIENNEISLHLVKVDEEIWETIVNPDAKDSAKRRQLVTAAVKYHEDKVKKDAEARAQVKAEQRKIALRKAMDQDSAEKDRIESVKQAERDTVAEEMAAWYSLDEEERRNQYLSSIKENNRPGEVKVDPEEEIPKDNSTVCSKYEKIKHNLANPLKVSSDSEKGAPELSTPPPAPLSKFDKIKHNLKNPLKDEKTDKVDSKPLWEINGPRQKQEIEVTFSKRYFPSAARESTAQQEEEWIEKNIKAQMKVKPKDGDTKEEERNPVWLNDKAGAFYKAANFPAAVNAYSEAIAISPQLPKLYINRASCYILLHLFEDAVTDCSRALELLTPPVEANRLSRVRCLAKRGSAYCQLQKIDRALDDYRLANKLDPSNESLKKDLNTLEEQSTSQSTLPSDSSRGVQIPA